MTTKKYTLAILDEESKERDHFINFFEDTFDVIEIPFVSSADELIDKIKTDGIDAIAIDYKLKDHNSKFKQNGDYFFKEVVNRLQEFPSFVITQDAEKAKKESKLIKPRFIVDKKILHSSAKDEVKAFKIDMTREIKTYKDILSNKLKRLKQLQKQKQGKKGLDQSLENEYLTLNNEVSKAITGYSTLPLKYFSQETTRKLNAVITKTDTLIRELSKTKGKNK